MRTDLESFTQQMTNHIADSLQDAIKHPDWRIAAIDEAREGWARLNRRLARDDVPPELQLICARLALLFHSTGFPECGSFDPSQAEENQRIDATLRELIERVDAIRTDANWTSS